MCAENSSFRRNAYRVTFFCLTKLRVSVLRLSLKCEFQQRNAIRAFLWKLDEARVYSCEGLSLTEKCVLERYWRFAVCTFGVRAQAEQCHSISTFHPNRCTLGNVVSANESQKTLAFEGRQGKPSVL
jgi:hypothetical protein